MDSVETVDIETGLFKYVLIKVSDKQTKQEKYIVRGYNWAPYHGDIVEKIEPQLKAMKLSCFCVGGGRIEHDSEAKTIFVFGYSQGYGKADHSITCELLRQKYPDYNKIYWSDEGY
ncbi:14 kDa phosphohistidine phosphatase-like protein [Dinothrombium tinctorium]|uniref:Sex-regulated protein janus-B n=1 Tax=Dinothrombium tinctorium TaxID=1965070 RepID=A0A3S3NUN6_9ACAR|nr:14 kDa phosphohistidine phosphatase-like protein [Dinothrombium tinctorium]RWS08645.1 14 kDa phosphohistidine phosphatase-like protein [Dinothrombium tinctorium]